jgi:hypothetical protein
MPSVSATTFAALGAALVLLAACAPAAANLGTPTASAVPANPATIAPTDSGPTDAVTAAFHTAMAGGKPEQLNFLACVAGGSDAIEFSGLFGGLAELALAASGTDANEYWAAFATSFEDFTAVERSRSGDQAVVHVSVLVRITPNIAKLRDMMRRNHDGPGNQTDDAAIDAIINKLVGRMQLDKVVEHDMTATRSNGAWLVCGL